MQSHHNDQRALLNIWTLGTRSQRFTSCWILHLRTEILLLVRCVTCAPLCSWPTCCWCCSLHFCNDKRVPSACQDICAGDVRDLPCESVPIAPQQRHCYPVISTRACSGSTLRRTALSHMLDLRHLCPSTSAAFRTACASPAAGQTVWTKRRVKPIAAS